MQKTPDVFLDQALGKGGGLPCRGKIWCFLSLNVDSHIKLMSSAI